MAFGRIDPLRSFVLACVLWGAGLGAAWAEGLDLSAQDRAAFHAALRDLFLSEPELLLAPLRPPSPYEEEAAADRAMLDFQAKALFAPDLPGFGATDAPVRMALLTGPDCPDCKAALAEAESLAQTHPLRVTLVDVSMDPDLLEALDLDTLPAYVFDSLIVRGHVPPVVLERYIGRYLP